MSDRPASAKPFAAFVLAAALAVAAAVSAGVLAARRPAVVAEGVLYSVMYERDNGNVSGLSRGPHVPGGNGNHSVDAYARLTSDYLVVTYPRRRDHGPDVIPADRLIRVEFGERDIPTVR